ncbi:uncharacterized protein LOC135471755 isoform X2 [Liolophura sinensis]|uniref:uncharacterized protein LOC135471755 isoform X2 n=1 Tax=Liolophura sinensis TaxID=3198878 RepID=UPI0031583966
MRDAMPSSILAAAMCLHAIIHGVQAVSSHQPMLMFVVFDGFRWDYMDKFDLPNFQTLATDGVRAGRVLNVMPTLTMASHFTMLTGLYPETHGMVLNDFHDPVHGDYDMYTHQHQTEAKWFDTGAEPIWVTNQKAAHDRFSAAMTWPTSLAPVMGIEPTFHKGPLYDITIKNKTRIDGIIRWFLHNEKPVNLGLLYFDEPDLVGHAFGPNSKQLEDNLIDLDIHLGYLISQLKKHGLFENLNLIVTADHGMADVPKHQFINISEFVSRDLYDEHGLSSILFIHPKPGLNAMDLNIPSTCGPEGAVVASVPVILGESGNTEIVEACSSEVSPIIHLSTGHEMKSEGTTIMSTVHSHDPSGAMDRVIVQNCDSGQEEIVHLDLANESQSLLQKITSQDAECQTILQELMDNINDPKSPCENNVAMLPSISNGTATQSCELPKNQPIVAHVSGDMDWSKPLTSGSKTEVMINGKKCYLIMNSQTGQLDSFQVGDLDENVKKKRGRPRRVVKADEEGQEQETQTGESQTDAAEGLLELYNTGPDGVRRSIRKRIRAKALDGYEVKPVGMTIPAILKKVADSDQAKVTPSTSVPIKRGRGRPRRYPRVGEGNPTQIPAVIIPGPNGQTLMMAPIKGLQNLQAFQQQMKTLPPLAPQPGPAVVTDIVNSSIVTGIGPDNSGDKANINGVIESAGSTLLAKAENAQSAVLTLKQAGDGGAPGGLDNTGQQISMCTTFTPDGKATILNLPSDMINLYTKKEPVKLGLKATENDLERLKCIKCHFQAYFPQQYQDHILTHQGDIHQCKCCKYVSFERLEVLQHTREFHPRCICKLCDFTSEHAYMIKRHLLRHNSEGFACDICGKIYKDKYILKMHTKMVHMPADVLFECNTCDKKFTRKAHLKRHLRIHEADKPHKCSMCDYKGCEKSDLLKHEIIHRDPEYLCDICGKQFRHVKNKELHVKRHRGQKDYKCGICDFYGYTFTDIRKHIERKHSEVNRLMEGVCEHCGTSFKTAAQLDEHRSQCLEMTIEQTLSITNSAGETSQALLRLPRSVQVNVEEINITVEEVPMEELEVDLEEHGITLTEDQFAQAVQDPARNIEFDSSGLVRDEATLEQLMVTNHVDQDKMITMSQ